MIKITVLNKELKQFDDRKSGFCLYIQASDKKILLDAGIADEAIVNAGLLNIDLTDIDCIVLSHGHIDHTDGLRFMDKSKKIIAHPSAFEKKFVDDEEVGIKFDKKEFKNLVLSKEPYWIVKDKVLFLGKIPRDFEKVSTLGKLSDGKEDSLEDDSALVLFSKKGMILVFGCAHSGIMNTIEHVKKTYKKEVFAIVGGFHLIDDIDKTKKILDYLEKNGIEEVYPMHCLDKASFDEFLKRGFKKLKTRETLYLDY